MNKPLKDETRPFCIMCGTTDPKQFWLSYQGDFYSHCKQCYKPKGHTQQPRHRGASVAERRRKVRVREKYARRKRRFQAQRILGNKCVRCGFSDWRALVIDHVKGGGTHAAEKDRSHAYTDVIAGQHLDRYQLLCANCNTIKQCENKEWGRPPLEPYAK